MNKLEKEIKKLEMQRSKEPGKYYGECSCCESETVLSDLTDMCGPCTFGESDTIMGNW